MQVVTSENIQQLHQTGKVDEYKAPDAKAEPVKTEAEAKVETPPRGDDGKFVKQDGADVTTDKADKSAVDDEDQEDKDLPERVRKQIGKKHRAMKEAEETARQWWADKTAAEKRAEELERELTAYKNPKSQPNSDEPKPEDFKTNAEYIDAKVEWKFEKKEREAAQARNEAEQNQRQAEFITRLQAARKEIPDYDEVVGEAEIDVVPHVASYIADSDLGPKLGYHFAKHPDELERIQKLSPIRAIAELGKLESKLEKPAEAKAEAETTPAKVSKAPSPITTIAADAKAVVTKDPAKMTFQELREYERQKAESKRR